MQLFLLILLSLFSTVSYAALPLHIEALDDGAETRLVATNSGYAPIYVLLKFTDTSNVSISKPMPYSFVAPARTKIDVLTIRQASKQLPVRWRYTFTSRWGDPYAKAFPAFAYALPFEKGTRFSIAQNSDRKTTHTTPESAHAVDFSVPEGTPVLAARSGVVIERELSHRTAGTSPEYLQKANRILVAHDDGTIATYAHLYPGLAYAYVGQKVAQGQLLAWSGNTGYSTGPHLHFNVTQNQVTSTASLPINFIDPTTKHAFKSLPTGYRGTVGVPPAAPNERMTALAAPTLPVEARPRIQPLSIASPGKIEPRLPNAYSTPKHHQLSGSAIPSGSASNPPPSPYKMMGVKDIVSNLFYDLANITVRAFRYYTTGIAAPGFSAATHPQARYIELAMPAVLLVALGGFLLTVVQRLIANLEHKAYRSIPYLGLLIGIATYSSITILSDHFTRGISPIQIASHFAEYAAFDPGGTLFLILLVYMATWGILRTASPPPRLSRAFSEARNEPELGGTPNLRPDTDPTIPEPPASDAYGDLAALQKLIKNDPTAAHRLVQYELSSDPTITPDEAARRAYRRFSS